MSSFDFDYALGLVPIILKYLDVTLWMASSSLIIALAIAVMLALVLTFRPKGLTALCELFISFFRGTPLLVQLFLLYYGLPQLFPALKGMTAFQAAVIGLSLHFSAYMAEIIRAAILSVDKSQLEAALSTGMTPLQGMRRIVLPQAARIAIPGLMNTFIDLLKSTSLAFTLGVAEIMAKAQMEAASSFRFFESYLMLALVYWLLVLLFTAVQKMAEQRMNEAY